MEKEKCLRIEDEEGFESDIALMEGLFENPKKRYQKLLAVLSNHASPVNCVRWNNIGTLFASAADDGNINLWEYVGEMMVTSAFQKSSFNVAGESQQRFNPSSQSGGVDQSANKNGDAEQ